MNRRQLLKTLFGVAAAAALPALLPRDATALPLDPHVTPELGRDRQDSVATPKSVEGAKPETVRWIHRRRRYVRRFYYRPRYRVRRYRW